MYNRYHSNRYWNKTKITGGTFALITLIVTRILSMASSRFDDWGNKMIDDWLAIHRDDVLTWIVNNPSNLVSAIALFILIIIGVDWYLQARKPLEKRTTRKSKVNLSNPFEFIDREPLDKKPYQARWASAEIKNNSDYNIEECYVKLLDLIDPRNNKSIMKFNHRNFDWGRGMNRDDDLVKRGHPVQKPITITARDNAIFDVATTILNDNKIKFTFWQWHESEVLPVGKYEVIARAFGRWNKKQIYKDQSFILIYKGGNDISINKKLKNKREQKKKPSPRKAS